MNSDDFLDCYNKIDLYLKSSEDYESYESFAGKIKKSKNPVVRNYKDELISFGELRNAIVHNPKIGIEAIAEPHTTIVFRIKELYEKISNPKKVIPEFQFEVLGAKEGDYINNVLIKMREKSFSQFPVFDIEGKVAELINTNTISRWLSNNLEDSGTIVIDNIKVKDLMNEIEFKSNYKFISRNTSIYEAYNLFTEQIRVKNTNLDVLFITNSGKQSEKLIGLITIEDIASIIKP